MLQGKKVLLTGGSGLLGSTLIPLLEERGAEVLAPTSKDWDITKSDYPSVVYSWVPDLIIHCAAYTDVAGAEKNRCECMDLNIHGTYHVKKIAAKMGAQMVYISSDYVNFHPMGIYAFSKRAGEAFTGKHDLVIRTSFKKRGTWGKDALTKVFHPVWTNADWVDVIAPKIVDAVDTDLEGIVNIGTKKKLLKDLAQEEYYYVDSLPVRKADKLLGYKYPRDCTMDLTI
jgi:dTDP-4-dehydrorhamnose reductase